MARHLAPKGFVASEKHTTPRYFILQPSFLQLLIDKIPNSQFMKILHENDPSSDGKTGHCVGAGQGGRGLLAYRPTFSDWAVLHRCFAALARSEKRNKLPECIRFDLLMRAFFLFFLSFQLINLREVSEQRRCFGSSATNIQSNEACKLQTSHFRSRLTGCRSQKRLLNHSESQTFMTLALSRVNLNFI